MSNHGRDQRAPGTDERGGARLDHGEVALAATGTRWCACVTTALGDVLDGGHLLDVAHVGPTAVPGFAAAPPIDILARVHPWPLPADANARLADIGLEPHDDHDRTCHSHVGEGIRLHVVDHDNDHWHRQLALRDHLRTSADARAAFGASTDAFAALEAEALERSVERTGFRPVTDVVRALANAPTRWAVAGGWALDAMTGAPSRHHDDVDIAVDAAAAAALLDALTDHGAHCAWIIAGSPARYVPRVVGEDHPGGGHQAHARIGETWIDVVIEPWTDATWHYRRDPTITLPLERAVRSVAIDGVAVPVMAPEAVLLFKATTGGRRSPRPKDDADLPRALEALDDVARAWLHAALPEEHVWRKRLRSQ